jgi:hypothetical protein
VLGERLERAWTWCSTTTWGSARWQQGLAAAIATLVIAPQASVDASVGLDPSWEAVVALAPVQHIAWGPGLVFTYGPLGYLQTTAYYFFDQSVLATVYQFIVVAALFLGIAAALRQRYAPMTSLIGAFVTTGIAAMLQVGHGTAFGMMYPELAVLAALAWAAVPMLQQDPKQSTVFGTCIVLGAVAGFQLLVKFNTGLTILAIALATSVLLGRKALVRHCATVAAFAASTFIWWVIAGERLGDLPVWLRFSTDILSGYNESQALPLGPIAGPAALLSLAWIGALCVMFVRGRPEIPRSLVLLVGLLTVITVKSAFGRFDIWHLSMLLGVIVVAVAIIPVAQIRNRAFAVVAVALVFAYVGGAPFVHDRAVSALQAPVQGIDRLVTLAVPGRVEQRVQQAKARQRAIYAIPRRFTETIGSKTVHVDPDETSVVWAYDLAWRPAPVFATYSAYTPALDKLNSDTLTDGPDFVLSRVSATSPATGIDSRLGTQESPLYSRALLCNYTLSGVENRWALFTRTGPHCGPLTPISEVDPSKNSPVTVPAPSGPDMAVLVGIDLDPTVLDRLFQGTIAPLTTFTVVLDGVGYRLIAGNAAEPFLVVTPASVNGTNLEIHAHTIGVGRTQALGQGGVHARLRFFEMRVAPQAPAG